MPRLNRTAASLRILGDDLNPIEITKFIGKVPSKAEKKGDRVKRPNGSFRTARTGAWCVKVNDAHPGDLNNQISELLEGTSPDVEVWLGLSKRFRIEIFCGLFLKTYNEGIVISADTAKLLGSRGIALDLDIYGVDTD